MVFVSITALAFPLVQKFYMVLCFLLGVWHMIPISEADCFSKGTYKGFSDAWAFCNFNLQLAEKMI